MTYGYCIGLKASDIKSFTPEHRHATGGKMEASDQRTIQRFDMKLPVTVKSADGEAIEATTRDVSARGVFIQIDADLAPDSPLEFTLTLPPEITMTCSVRVHCTGRVLRTVRPKDGPVGIVAIIDNYKFVPEARASEAGAL